MRLGKISTMEYDVAILKNQITIIMKKIITLAILLPLLSSAVLADNHSQPATQDANFKGVLDEHWAWQMQQNPVFATSLGNREYSDKLSDPSLTAYDQSVETAKSLLTKLAAIEVDQLSAQNKLNHALLTLDLENQVEAAKYGGKYLIMSNRGGPHLNLTSMPDRLPFFNAADYRSYLARLKAMPDYLNKATDRIRAGLAAGWVQPCAPMKGFEQSIDVHVVDKAEDSVFMSPFKKSVSVIDKKQFAKMKSQATKIIEKEILPAFKNFRKFYGEEYAPKCRDKVGTDSMPGGKEYYDHRVKFFTTTDLTADEVHNIGLSEVKRIKAEMMDVIKEAKFDGNFEEWLIFLRDNPDFYPKTAEERMQVAAAISKKMDGELPKLFGKLPRMPYGLKEIPKDIAEKTTTAYYRQPAGDGTRAGVYFVNTSLLNTRPLYQLEALSLHEAVPGHHLQIALAQELDMPMFRRFGGQTVFVEGWALYSERLGLETGFYQTPYTNFGRLSYEMWRACRLVVDTGLHSKGWTRQQAIDYMAENSGLSMNNITSEVDRYISWPGQALAYKIGELKIRELRSKAEKELGKNFDIRQFHDRVLENGALPLSILEKIMNQWIEDSKQKLSK